MSPESLVQQHGKSVDLRIFFFAYPTSTYSILLLLEACHEVDKAIYGLGTIILDSIKLWHLPQDMTTYNYLLSEDLVFWLKRELWELSDEIHSKT